MWRFVAGLGLILGAAMAHPDINGIRNNDNYVDATARQDYTAPLADPISDASWSSADTTSWGNTATPSGFYNPNQNYGLGFNAQTDLGFGNGFLDSALRIVLFLAGISILAQIATKIMATEFFTNLFGDEGRALLGRSINPENVQRVFDILKNAQDKYE